MYKNLLWLSLFSFSLSGEAQDLKFSSPLWGEANLVFDNGYKKIASHHRAIMLDYEKKLKWYSWSYSAGLGWSMINYNQRIDSMTTDSHNSFRLYHFRPFCIKKYYRISGTASYYIEAAFGLNYLARKVQHFERADMPTEDIISLGFSLGAGAKMAFKVELNKQYSFDLGFGGTDDFWSSMYIDDAKLKKVRLQSESVFMTIYKSVKKKNEKVPRIPFTDN